MPRLPSIVLLIGLLVLLPVNLWFGYFPYYKGPYHELPVSEVLVHATDHTDQDRDIPVRAKLEKDNLVAALNIGQPIKYLPDTYVRVLLQCDYDYRICRRIGFWNLTILAATLFLWGATMLYSARRSRSRV